MDEMKRVAWFLAGALLGCLGGAVAMWAYFVFHYIPLFHP